MEKEKELLEGLDEPIELFDEEGNKSEFYHIGTMEFEGKNYAFFQPAESVEGADPDDVVIFEIDEKNQVLLPIEDEDYLEKIFDKFQIEYNEQFADEEEDADLIN
jgi:uncharacterized protein YrzB (UPF0473 family)